MGSWPETEQQVGEEVVKWLRAHGWETYCEVEGPGGRCDIVATKGPLVWAIEVKQAWNLVVVDQAAQKRPHCHMTSIAVAGGKLTEFKRQIMLWQEIGCIWVGPPTGSMMYPFHHIQEIIKAKLHRKNTGRIKRRLREEHKAQTPGTQAPGWTPFKGTCNRAAEYVRIHGGRVLYKTLVDSIETHYSTPGCAKRTFAACIDRGIVPGVQLERDGKILWVVSVKPNSQPR